jgi:hypothetical protein
MENQQQGAIPSLMISGTMKKRRSEENPVEECRSLVRILARKTENLYRSCRSDRHKAMHIRAMGSALTDLNEILDKFDREPEIVHAVDILEDAHGFTYRSVRSCDLDRISEK